MAKLEGKTLGAYRVVSQIGAGGMATIYKAYHPAMDRTVALKVLPEYYAQDPQFVERFYREARTIAKLEHPNILPVYDFGEQDGITYLVMRFLDGGTLQEKMSERRFSLHQAADTLAPICAALDYAHRKGIVHRDVKPSNILIDQEGGVYLSDFGIAKVVESSSRLTQTGASVGTPAYMSPEQCMGKPVDSRSDIYSLGVILYEMAVGRVPFEADTPLAVLFAHVNDPLPLPRSLNLNIPEAMQNVILKAMAKNPEDRFKTAAEMGAALRRATPAEEPPAAPVQPAAQPPEETASPLEQNQPADLPGSASQGYQRTITVNAQDRAAAPSPAPISKPAPPRKPVKQMIIGSLVVIGVLALAGLTWRLVQQPASTATPTIAAAQVETETNTVQPADTMTPTQAATETLSISSQGQRLKVGLVTDTAGIQDNSYNQATWAGIQEAAAEFDMDAAFLESSQAADVEANIDTFAAQQYNVIVTVGFLVGDATAIKAKQYPAIKFVIIDNAYTPSDGAAYCASTVKDCYLDGGLTNVTSLMFREDQAGFLAGVLAAGMTRTGKVCSVAGIQVPPVERYVTNFQSGAKWYRADIQTLNYYNASFSDPEAGIKTGNDMIAQGCDVVFGAGGDTGNGGLLAAKQANLMAIGVDVDQFNSFPEASSVIMSSAMKKYDAVIYTYLQSISNKTDQAGIVLNGVANDGVGLAPFHDWEAKIPADVKTKIQEAVAGLQNGSITLAGENQDPLKIAILAPLSGPVPTFGTSSRDGAQLAIDEWNARGGVLGMKIVPVIEDSQCAADAAGNAAKKVIDQDKVHYIIGEVCSNASIPVSEIANANHVVQISGTSTNPNVVRDANGDVKPYTFVACYNDESQGKVMAKFAFQNLDARTVFILWDPADVYVSGLAALFEKYFTAAGGAIVGKETYRTGETNFATILAKVAAAKPDLVLLPDYYNVANLVTAQAKQQGITTPFLGGDGWDSPDLDLAAADGSYFTDHYSPTQDWPAVQTFVTNYGSRYKDEQGHPKVPDAIAALTYDATNMLLESIQAAGVDDPDKVKDALEAGNFNEVTGFISFDAFHTPVKPITIVQISGGRMQFYTQVQPD